VILAYSKLTKKERVAAMRELIESEEDMMVPKSLHQDEIPSLKKWLLWWVEYAEQGTGFDRKQVAEGWHEHFLTEDYYIYVPTPFKRGDILCRPEDEKGSVFQMPYSGNVFVLLDDYDEYTLQRIREDETCECRVRFPYSSDGTDMCMHCAYLISADGILDYDNIEASAIDLSFFHGELKGHDRILKHVSHYLKEEICLEHLIGAQNMIRLEEQAKQFEYVMDNLEYAVEQSRKNKDNRYTDKLLLARKRRLCSAFRWTEENKARFLEINNLLLEACEKVWAEGVRLSEEIETRIAKGDEYLSDYEIEIRIDPFPVIEEIQGMPYDCIPDILAEYFTDERTVPRLTQPISHCRHESSLREKPLLIDRSINWNDEYFDGEFDEEYICYAIHVLRDTDCWTFQDILSINVICTEVKVEYQSRMEKVEGEWSLS
jgi:hypothetical protein